MGYKPSPAELKDYSIEQLEKVKTFFEKQRDDDITFLTACFDAQIEGYPDLQKRCSDIKITSHDLAKCVTDDIISFIDRCIRVKKRAIYQRTYYLQHKGKNAKTRYNKD